MTRIVPLYWVATVFTILWENLGFTNMPYTAPLWANWIIHDPMTLLRWFGGQLAPLADHNFLGKLIKSLLFIPYPNASGDLQPLLGVGWTLNLEMFFYLLFAAALWVSCSSPFVLVALALLGIKFMMPSVFPPAVAFYGHHYTIYFVLGIAAFYAWRLLPVAFLVKHRRILAMGAAGIALVFVAGQTTAFIALFNRYGDVMPALLVLAALALHSAKLPCNWKPALVLGDASYALYLTHPIVLTTLRILGSKWRPLNFQASWIGMTIALALSCLVAIGTHHWVRNGLSSVCCAGGAPARQKSVNSNHRPATLASYLNSRLSLKRRRRLIPYLRYCELAS